MHTRACIQTQLADMAFLPAAGQKFMVRLFTAITTAGVLGIPIVGRLMDQCGFVATAAVMAYEALRQAAQETIP